MKYDPDLCVTAGELRKMNVKGIPDRIPDCAWIPKYALELDIVNAGPGEDDRSVNISMTFRTTEPFRYVTAEITFPDSMSQEKRKKFMDSLKEIAEEVENG